jgi:ATP-dependent helicase/nuclease subunit B
MVFSLGGMKRQAPQPELGFLQVVESGATAAEALQAAVGSAKRADPMAAVTVVVPSALAGLSLRRSMAAGSGLFNVRFLVLSGLAELLGAPAVAARRLRPLDADVYYRLIGRALTARGGPFRRAVGHPAALLALAGRLTELRRADPEIVAALGGTAGAPGALVALGEEVRRQASGRYYDAEDLVVAAAAAVDQGAPALSDVGHVVIYLPQHLSPGYRALIDALRRRERLTVIVALTGDESADRPTRELLDVLDPGGEHTSPGGRARVPFVERFIVTPDAELEVRTVAREIYARMEAGTPLHRMAVLYRSSEPYARLLQEHLSGCGLPVAGPGTTTLGQSVSGRTLSGLLGLPDGDFSRQAVMALANAAPLRTGRGGSPLPVKDWEELSRAANIVAGPRSWAERLAHLGAGLRQRAEAAAERGDDPSRYERRAARVDGLAAWMATLVERCGRRPARGWAEQATWAAALLSDYLDIDLLDASELEAHRRVLAVLQAMASIPDDDAGSGSGSAASDSAGRRPEPAGGEGRGRDDPVGEADDGTGAFDVALGLALAERVGRLGPIGGGVYVGPLTAAAGGSFDLVVVVGMAEGHFPPRRIDDPLLPDRVRSGAGTGGLAGRRRQRDEERRAFLAALDAAPVRILTTPRSDQRSFQPRLPARWFVDVVSARAGRPVGADELSAPHPEWPWFVAVESLPASVASGAGNETEWLLGALGRWTSAGRAPASHPQVRQRPALARGLAAVQARAVGSLTAWEGLVGRHPSLAIDPSRPLSPTSLQRWAECPRRYLLDSVLRVAETLRPEEVLRLNPLDRGTLVHDALERFFREAAAVGDLGETWTDTDSERLMDIVSQGCDEVEAQGLTGKPVLWAMQRQVLLDELARFLARDTARRISRGLVPTSFEVAFGGSADEIGPVTFTTGRRTLRFRGRIDRIDVTADGAEVEVIDYKTGGAQRYAALDRDCVDAGRLLQLPVYALAAAQAYPTAEVSASYWFVTDSDSRHQHKQVPLTEANQSRFGSVIGHIADGIEDGLFPANPGKEDRESWVNCRYCPYDRVCPTHRDEVWERVAMADGARAHVSLQADGDGR